MLFHSLTEREKIPVTAEQWFPSERGNIYLCHTVSRLLSSFAAGQNQNNLNQLHGSFSD